jgi:ketosteroid isomerase-like protein
LIFFVLSVLAAFGLTACTQADASGAANVQISEAITIDSISVVKDYYDAFNKKQVEAAMNYLADDVLFINPTGTYEGKSQIQKHLQELANEGLSFDLSEFKDEGGRVTYAYKVLQNGQVLDEGTDGLTIVKSGKIVFDGTETTEPKP